MIYYRDKYCKLFEEDSNESNNINIDNSSEMIMIIIYNQKQLI